MAHNTLHIPGYRISEYLLVLHPHDELGQKIYGIKAEFAHDYRHSFSETLKSHIALVHFHAYAMMEEKIVQRLQLITMGVAPFKVELKDFGSFPSHTIFINVLTRLPVEQLVRDVKEAQRLLTLNGEHKPHFINEPHIAIARKLKPWQFEKGWLEHSHRHFTGRFVANDLLLLKRPAGEKAPWQICKRFEFMNLPVATRQATLFA
jgi:2'-5' RNA ligase